jgi:hypothetical protein
MRQISPPRRHADVGSRQPRSALRWVIVLVGTSSVVLLPWIAYLAMTLPPSMSARHWPLAWSGLDGAMAVGLGVTAWLAIRGDRRVRLVAVATATLLLSDAWFDVCTSPPGQRLAWAIVDMGIEVGEAAACLVLARAVCPNGRDPQSSQDERAGSSWGTR